MGRRRKDVEMYAAEDRGHATECWIWVGARTRNGYASMRRVIDGITHHVGHRWFYHRYIGPIPDGLVIDHLCRVRDCVNPSHLEPVTQSENCRRGDTGKHNADKTHCPRGHPLVEGNLAKSQKGRWCLICSRESERRKAKRQWQKKLQARIES